MGMDIVTIREQNKQGKEKEAFARLEQLRRKGTVTDEEAELASYREDKYGK